MDDLFAESLQGECMHGLTKRTCSICLSKLGWGALRNKPYRRVLAEVAGEEFAEDVKERFCERCARRGVTKGNRLNVRLPRERKSFAVPAPGYPPSFEGPLVVRPRVRRASHRRNGHWLCDRCDPKHAAGEEEKDRVFTTADIFV